MTLGARLSCFASESVEWSPEDCNFSRLLVLRSPNLFNETSYCFGRVTAPFYGRIAANLRAVPLDKDKFEFKLRTHLLEAGAPARNTKRVLNGPLAVLTDDARSRQRRWKGRYRFSLRICPTLLSPTRRVCLFFLKFTLMKCVVLILVLVLSTNYGKQPWQVSLYCSLMPFLKYAGSSFLESNKLA